jgi:catechol 2,3-dioxygenase-like lactoylglutathione lyase family enzyme
MAKPLQTTPVFHVADLTAALRYYLESLGFDRVFTWGTPPFYAGVRMGSTVIHLNASREAADRRGKGAAYIFIERSGVDDYYKLVAGRGATIVGDPPKAYEYGLKDFKLADPDGNWLSFGEEC